MASKEVKPNKPSAQIKSDTSATSKVNTSPAKVKKDISAEALPKATEGEKPKVQEAKPAAKKVK